jgi:hypothetical protein
VKEQSWWDNLDLRIERIMALPNLRHPKKKEVHKEKQRA